MMDYLCDTLPPSYQIQSAFNQFLALRQLQQAEHLPDLIISDLDDVCYDKYLMIE